MGAGQGMTKGGQDMDQRKRTYFAGWEISFNPLLPITSRWRAVRFGVGMCAGDYDALVRMIRARVESARVERAERGIL